MSTPDKVMNAVLHAKRHKRMAPLKFDTVNGVGFFVTFDGNRILEFDSNQESTDFKNQLNAAITPVMNIIKAHYKSKMDAEL